MLAISTEDWSQMRFRDELVGQGMIYLSDPNQEVIRRYGLEDETLGPGAGTPGHLHPRRRGHHPLAPLAKRLAGAHGAEGIPRCIAVGEGWGTMSRTPFFTLALCLTVTGITFGTFVYRVDAPLVWSMGYMIAGYGAWLGIHSWRRLPPSPPHPFNDEVPDA